jgi:hypothetical protein
VCPRRKRDGTAGRRTVALISVFIIGMRRSKLSAVSQIS